MVMFHSNLCSTAGLPAAFETVMSSPARKPAYLHLQRNENCTRSWLQNVTDIRSIAILARVNATDENARHILGNYLSGNLCFSTIITPTRATIYLEISHFRSNCATSFCSCLYQTATRTRSNILNSDLVSITTYCIFKTYILKQTRSTKPISPKLLRSFIQKATTIQWKSNHDVTYIWMNMRSIVGNWLNRMPRNLRTNRL